MTIRLDRALDLGKDVGRMTAADKERQEATVNRLLEAFFGPPAQRRELQLLADEVGLGKTFVALATAFSVLRVMRDDPDRAKQLGLQGCYRAVIVVAPSGNQALAEKWVQEAEALGTRCSLDSQKTNWFKAKQCHSSIDLVNSLRLAHDRRRNPTNTPSLLICKANIFQRRITGQAQQLQFLAACLFRWWGNKLSHAHRSRLIRRVASHQGFEKWRESPRLWDFRAHERGLAALDRQYESVPFTYAQIARALDKVGKDPSDSQILNDESGRTTAGKIAPSGLLPFCRFALTKCNVAETFEGLKSRLNDLYKTIIPHLIAQDLPLVIVDEAHHWRHSQRQDAKAFHRLLAPRSRRLLLLTATPFQLHREELIEILSVSKAMSDAIGDDRVEELTRHLRRIEQAMDRSEEIGKQFSREWGGLAVQFDESALAESSIIPNDQDPRTQLIKQGWEMIRSSNDHSREEALSNLPDPLRSFFLRALELQQANKDLGEVLRRFVIRHRRDSNHRRYRIGRDYPPSSSAALRPDHSQVHQAPGAQIPPHAELAQYLLMKVAAKADRRRTALGMDLTGCYTTLWKSGEGHRVIASANEGPGKGKGKDSLLKLLQQITGYHGTGGRNDASREDARHPKVKTVVDETLRRWELGDKTLIFCFRVPTAETLYRLLRRGIDQRLKTARTRLVETRRTRRGDHVDEKKAMKTTMQQFRHSLTSREGTGVALFLDRVLIGWFLNHQIELPRFEDADRRAVANIYARAKHGRRPLQGDRHRYDRVFLHRAIEHVWAKRLLESLPAAFAGLPQKVIDATESLLEQMADESWVRYRYGIEDGAVVESSRPGNDDTHGVERVARSSVSARYQLVQTPDEELARQVEKDLQTKSGRRRNAILDSIIAGPNLFAPVGSTINEILDHSAMLRIERMRRTLFRITQSASEQDGNQNGWSEKGWRQRADVVDAVVRALLREDILLRLPSEVFRGHDRTWKEALLRGFHTTANRHQHESLAGRVEAFLQELAEMGPVERQSSLRHALNPKAEAVALVTGRTNIDRAAVFQGFNTPLLPDILICTQVGQEGIDLHRHCRHVVHFDLGWNPATLEQRTGRVDRIGSKTFRDRHLACEKQPDLKEPDLPGLDIGLPYLAGTYDERMFACLLSRAQTFEILTGGNPSADRDERSSWLNADNPEDDIKGEFVHLPNELLAALRVHLECGDLSPLSRSAQAKAATSRRTP